MRLRKKKTILKISLKSLWSTWLKSNSITKTNVSDNLNSIKSTDDVLEVSIEQVEIKLAAVDLAAIKELQNLHLLYDNPQH